MLGSAQLRQNTYGEFGYDKKDSNFYEGRE